ncbi:MAG: glycosyltransferase family 4 protein, partial [Cyanobium sp.]
MTALPGSIALVHEWFTPRSVGGAELVVRELDSLLGSQGRSPSLFALVDGESRRAGSWLEGRAIRTSFIQRLPWGRSHVQQYLPLLPLAIEQLDLGGHPLVISSSHLVAKGVLTSPEQWHLSYVHTPARYAWDQMHAYLARSAIARSPLGPLVRLQLHQLRQWDALSAQRVDLLVANSRFTAGRIRRCWRRHAVVVPPP